MLTVSLYSDSLNFLLFVFFTARQQVVVSLQFPCCLHLLPHDITSGGSCVNPEGWSNPFPPAVAHSGVCLLKMCYIKVWCVQIAPQFILHVLGIFLVSKIEETKMWQNSAQVLIIVVFLLTAFVVTPSSEPAHQHHELRSSSWQICQSRIKFSESNKGARSFFQLLPFAIAFLLLLQ